MDFPHGIAQWHSQAVAAEERLDRERRAVERNESERDDVRGVDSEG